MAFQYDETLTRTEARGEDKATIVHVCCDCRAWAHTGDVIRHSRRCATPNAQHRSIIAPVVAAAPRAARSVRSADEDVRDFERDAVRVYLSERE